MGRSERREVEEDPELSYLEMKARGSLSNVINEVLKNETIKKTISRAVIRQSIKTGIFLSCLIVGFMTLFNALKSIFGLGWKGDLVVGVTLIIIGVAYVRKKLNT